MASFTSVRSGSTSDTNPATNPWGAWPGPVMGDKVTVASGHTVTIDSTEYWGDDTTTAITVNGTLAASRSTNSQLTCRGNLNISATGTLDQGTVASPIPSGVTHTLILNDSATLAAGKYGLVTVNGAQHYVHGAAKGVNAYLTSQANVSDTTILVDDATGWASGDAIILAPTETSADKDERTISGAPVDNGNGTWTVTLSSGLSNVHRVGGPVGNFTHNVVFTSSNLSYTGYVTQEWGATQTAGTRDIRYARFAGLGVTGGGNERKWGALNIYGGTASTQAAGSPIYVKGISIYNTGSVSYGLNVFTTKHRITIDDIAVHVANVASMAAIYEAYGCIIDLNRAVTYGCYNALTSSYGQGGVGVRHQDCMFLGAGSYVCNFAAAMRASFERCVFDASVGAFLYAAALGLEFTDCEFGTRFAGFGLSATAGIWQANYEGAIATATITDSSHTGATVLVNTATAGARIQDTSEGSEIRFANLSGDPLSQTIYTPGGVLSRDQVTVYSSYDSSLKCAPLGGTAIPLTSVMQVMAPNGVAVVVTGWAYIATAYNGSAPTVSMSGLGVSESVSLDLGVRDAWQQFVVVATQSSGADGVLALTLSCTGTAGAMYWCGLSNPPSVAIATGGFGWWDGGAPVEALLANFVAAADVWGMQRAQAAPAGSIGEALAETWRRVGLDPDAPLVTSQTQITAGAGITIDLTEDGQTVTATRQ